MRVSRKINQSISQGYELNGCPLQFVDSYKYLGVHITNNLSWQKHIHHVINKANSTLGFLRRNFRLTPVPLKLLLYKTLVRSKLEYASPIYGSTLAR